MTWRWELGTVIGLCITLVAYYIVWWLCIFEWTWSLFLVCSLVVSRLRLNLLIDVNYHGISIKTRATLTLIIVLILTWNRDQMFINYSKRFIFQPRWCCIYSRWFIAWVSRLFVYLRISFAQRWSTFCHYYVIVAFSDSAHLHNWDFTLSLTSFFHADLRFETHGFLYAIIDWTKTRINVTRRRFFRRISFLAWFIYFVEQSLESKGKFWTCSWEHRRVMFFQF